MYGLGKFEGWLTNFIWKINVFTNNLYKFKSLKIIPFCKRIKFDKLNLFLNFEDGFFVIGLITDITHNKCKRKY